MATFTKVDFDPFSEVTPKAQTRSVSFDDALRSEGISGRLADVARSIYQQESGSGRNTSTSNAGAVGHMQIIPATFQRVADRGWSIQNPEHNMRAGLRYIKMLDEKAGGDPRLIAAGYYGGEGAIPLAAQGKALRDPLNPNAPDTLQYAQQVASRMPSSRFVKVDYDPFAQDFSDVTAGVSSAPKKSTAQMVRQEIAESVPVQAARGVARGVKDVIDTGAELMASGFDKIAGTNEAERVRAINAAGKSDFSASMPQGSDLDKVVSRGTSAASRIGGNIIATLPLISAAGAGVGATGLTSLGNAIRTGGMSTGASVAPGGMAALQNLATRTAGGAAAGAIGAGMVDPESANTGAVIGAALPGTLKLLGAGANAVGGGLRGIKAAAEPFYQTGRDLIKGRALQAASGGGRYADDAAAALSAASPIIPGSLPTVGQAASNPGIAALERAAVATNPAVAAEHSGRMVAQNAARIEALQKIAGSDGARDFARAELQATADDLYKQAFEKGVNLSRNAATGGFTSKAEQAGIKGEITKLMKTPAMQQAVEQAKVMMRNEMKSVSDPSGSVMGLHYTKKALDDMIQGATGNEQRILIGLRDRMLTTVDRLSPEYSAARAVFRDMARPVNEMDIAAEIAKVSINPATERMTLSAFARALNDKTAARATGFNKATLEGSMSPENMGVLRSLLDDLRRADFAANAGRGPGSNTVQNLAYSNIINQAGIPNFMRSFGPLQTVGNLLTRGGDIAYSKANQRLSEELAQAMMTPQEAARLMRMAKSTGGPNALSALLANPVVPQIAYRAAPVLPANR